MAGNERRRARDIPEESFGSGLLRRARNVLAGRSRQVDDEVDRATGNKPDRRTKRNKQKRGLRR